MEAEGGAGKSRLVILGTGFASISAVKTIDLALYDVIVISPRNHFLFTPLLPSTTVGTIEFRSIIEPIRTIRSGVTYFHASCTSADPARRLIACEHVADRTTFTLGYDHLVIAVGAVSNTYGVPGVGEHALFLKELSDARAIRQRIIDCFEHASTPGLPDEDRRRLLQFLIVGGGPTGVEFAAELHDFIWEDLRDSFPPAIRDVRIVLLEAGEQILSTFDEALGSYTTRHFRRQGIDIRTGSVVVRVEATAVVLGDGSRIPYGMLVWSTGIGPTPFVRMLPFERDRASRILTDAHFRVKGHQHIYAIGDCAAVGEHPQPATSQVAQQQGIHLARSLNRLAHGREPKPFRYRHYGMLAYVGGNRALADLSALKGHGFTTWLFWRSAYLTKLVSLKNKILVLFDWLKTLVFGRDISRF